MTTVPCPNCSSPMPASRLTMPVANGVCIPCNRNRRGLMLVEGACGFKNNGSSLVTVDVAREIKIANPVRG